MLTRLIYHPIHLFVFWLLYSISPVTAQYQHFDSIISQKTDLPVTFDLRHMNRFSPVRVQAAGGCWSAAAMASLESFILSGGGPSYHFSDRNLYRFHRYDSTRTTYGNHMMATAYFVRGAGPYISTPGVDTVFQAKRKPVLWIDQARFLPNDPNLIKRTILEFGGVSSMLRFRPETLDSLTHIHYAKGNAINHVVNLVGWSDTMETNYGKGVWIAQNSLGVKSGDSGFFYIPYQDQRILQYNAVWPDWKPFPNQLKLLYYDTLGQTSTYGFEDTVCYSLIKFKAPANGKLKAIATWSTAANSIIESTIYRSFDENKKVLNDSAGYTAPFLSRFEGYYTIEMEKPVPINKGETFYIKIRYSVPADTSRVPVEKRIDGYAYPTLVQDKCWINPDEKKWPDTWYLCGKTSKYPALRFNLCIKACFYSD